MEIVLNGSPTPVDDGATLVALVRGMALEGKRYAVEVNEEVVPRSEHAGFRLSEGDRVEIVHAIGGG